MLQNYTSLKLLDNLSILSQFLFHCKTQYICVNIYLYQAILKATVTNINKYNHIIIQQAMYNQHTYLNSCELLIQEIMINKNDQYYLVWSKGKRYIQSNQYQLTQLQPQFEDNYDESSPKQYHITANDKIQLNLKLYTEDNGKKVVMQPKNTHLTLIRASDDSQICQFILNVQEWTQNYQHKQLTIAKGGIKGTISISMRRTTIMQLDNFQKFAGEIQQSEEDEEPQNELYHSFMGEVSSQRIISMQQEIEDKNYLLQKLKNDRNTTLTRNQYLQKQMRHLKTNIKRQIKRIEDFYKEKIDVRQSIYREEIQQIISTFNENSRVNYQIVKNIIQENQQLYAELVNTRQNFKQQTQNINYQHQVARQEFQEEKLKLQQIITSHERAIQELKSNNQSLNLQLQVQKQENAALEQNINKKQEENSNKEAEYQNKIQVLMQEIAQLNTKLKNTEEDLRDSQKKANQFSENIKELNEMIRTKQKQMAQQMNERFRIDEELNRVKVENQSIKIQNEQFKAQIQKFREQYKQLIQQGDKKQKYYEEKQQQLIRTYEQENQKVLDLMTQQHNLEIKIRQIESQLAIRTEQIIYKDNDIERLKEINMKLQENVKQMTDAYDEDARRLTQKLELLELQCHSLKLQNDENNQEIRRTYDRHNEEMDELKHQFQQIKRIREQQFQNQLEIVKERNDEYLLQQTIRNQELDTQNRRLIDQKMNIYEELSPLKQKNFILSEEIESIRQQNLNYQQEVSMLKSLMDQKDDEYKIMLERVRESYEDVLNQPKKQLSPNDSKKNLLGFPMPNLQAAKKDQTDSEHLQAISKLEENLFIKEEQIKKEKIQLQSQWEELKKAYEELSKEQEELRLKHQRLNVFQQFEGNKQQKSPMNLLGVPKHSKKKIYINNLQDSIELPSLQKGMQPKQINHSQSSMLQQFKQTMQNLASQLKDINYENSKQSFQSYKQAYADKMQEMQKQARIIDKERLDEHQMMLKLKQQLSHAEDIIYQYEQREKEYETKLLEYQAYISDIQMKMQQYDFERQTRRNFENISESKIEDKIDQQSIERKPSANQFDKILKRKSTDKLDIRIPTSPKQSYKSLPKNVQVSHKQVQTEDLQEFRQSQEQNSKIKIEDISFKDIQFLPQQPSSDNQPQKYQKSAHLNPNKVYELQQRIKQYQKIFRNKKIQFESFKKQKNAEVAALTQKIENYKQRLEQQAPVPSKHPDFSLKNNIQQKYSQQVSELKKRNRELFDQLSFLKQELRLKSNLQESKILQYENKQLQTKKSLISYDQKLSSMKEMQEQKQQKYNNKIQALTMELFTLKHEKQLHESENSNLRKQIQQIRANQKNTKNGNSLVSYLQEQVEQTNKKLLEFTKDRNKLEIMKQNLEDQLTSYKNKYAQNQKILSKQNQEINELRRENDDLLRNVNKKRRQIEDNIDELNKLRQLVKKYETDIKNMNNNQSLFKSQRKNLEAQLEMEENVLKKQAEIRKLNKQLSKIKQQFAENFENIKQNLSNKTKQCQKLELQNIKLKKLAHNRSEQTQQLLHNRENSEQFYRSEMQQLNKKHSQKLKFYIHQITNIKGILEQTQIDMQNLRIQNTSLLEELDATHGNLQQQENRLNKMQQLIKFYEQEVDQYKNINSDLQNNLKIAQANYLSCSNDLIQAKQKLEKQQLISLKKSQKLQQYQIVNEKYIYEIKNLKIKVNDYDTKKLIDQNYQTRISQIESQNQNLLENLAKINKQYMVYKTEYQYTSVQIEQLLNQFQQNAENSKKRQLDDLRNQLMKNYQAKTSNTEAQLLKLYNQNVQNGILLQQKENQFMQLLQKYHEIQFYPQKYQELKKQNQFLTEELQISKNQSSCLSKQLQALDYTKKQQQRIIDQLSHQRQLLTNDKKQLLAQTTKLQQQVLELQTGNEFLKTQLIAAKTTKSQQQQSLSELKQNQNTKILSLQLQNQRIKQRQINLQKEYTSKISSMESLVNQLKKERKQVQALLAAKNSKSMNQINNILAKTQSDYDAISQKFRNTNLHLAELQQENKELKNQLANLREQSQQDEELYIMEVNNLKSTIADMQQLYTSNVNSLEEQLAILNRQLTQQRLSKNQLLRGSRFKNSVSLRDSQAEKKYEDKIKNKDNKIQQLRNQIFALEEEMSKYRKIAQDDKSQEYPASHYRQLYTEATKKLSDRDIQSENQRNTHFQAQRELKKQLNASKQSSENLKIQLEQANLIRQSIETELRTIKHLYLCLQAETEKHQKVIFSSESKLDGQDNSEFSVSQLQKNKIKDLEGQINNLKMELENTKISYMTKEEQILLINQELKVQKLKNAKKYNQYEEAMLWKERQLQNIKQLEILKQKLTKQNKNMSLKINNYESKIEQMEKKLIDYEIQNKKLANQNKIFAQDIARYKTKVNHYQIIQEKCLSTHNCDLEKFIVGGVFFNKMMERDKEIQTMQDELQQLKFMENQKLLDYQELNRQNFELQLQNQDYAETIEQLEHLRNITDKLEQEKKSAIFREEAIRIRLANLLESHDMNSMRESISAILDHDIY